MHLIHDIERFAGQTPINLLTEVEKAHPHFMRQTIRKSAGTLDRSRQATANRRIDLIPPVLGADVVTGSCTQIDEDRISFLQIVHSGAAVAAFVGDDFLDHAVH
jgi:hypothetical protein